MAKLNNGPYTNAAKEDVLLQKYYKENFEDEVIGKVNLDRNSVITNMKSASNNDYNTELTNKKIEALSKTTFNLNEQQTGLKLVAYCSTNYFDLNNPQKGRLDNKCLEALKKDITTKDTTLKTIVVFGGDLLGTEWTMAHLKKATINKDGVALYWGLNKRKKRLMADIKVALSLGAEVYLMKGAQEHKIFKETGRDILQEIVNEFHHENLVYINEGTTVICNLTRKEGKKTYKNTIAFQTNMIGKAKDNNGDYKVGLNNNGKVNADAVFVFNGNASGKFDNNLYHVSGQSLFKRTAKAKKPENAPKNFNVFTIYPEGNHELTIVEGSPENLYSNNLALEKKIHKEDKTRKILAKIAQEKFEEKIENILNEKRW